MLYRVIRMKVLDGGRLMGYSVIVLDGTRQLRFRQRHCPHCLQMTVNGTTWHYHNVLEAKLVTPEGLAISMETEFIENIDPHASKQDCELKAFHRLVKPTAPVPVPRRPLRHRQRAGHLRAESLEVLHRLQGRQPAGPFPDRPRRPMGEENGAGKRSI